MKAKICIGVLILISISLPIFAQSGEELIAEADALFMEMKDMETAQKVLANCRKAVGMMETNYEAFWRIARIMYYIGIHTEKKKEKKSIFGQGVYYADRAIEAEPEKPDGYYWQAVDNGKVGETRGVLKSLSLVKPIKKALNKVIELDRAYEDGGADMVMGRVYFKLPGIAGGSKDKSLEHLLKAMEYGPDDVTLRFYLAETYLKMKKKDEAKAHLEFILNMEDDPLWANSVMIYKAEAEALMKKKFK